MGSVKKAVKKVSSSVAKKVPVAGTAIKLGSAMVDPLGVVSDGAKGLLPAKTAGVAGGAAVGASALENKYGIVRPEYESLRGPDGKLRSEFAYDPSKSSAFQKLQEQAMAQGGDSPWARMQLEKQALEQSGARDAAAKSALQGVAQQQSSLARFGGLSGGARERLARVGAQTTARSQQDVARQGMLDRLGITEQDIGRQQQALGAVSEQELKGQAQNLQSLMGDVTGKQQFDLAKYKEQMAALGADKTANAQVQAANASRKK